MSLSVDISKRALTNVSTLTNLIKPKPNDRKGFTSDKKHDRNLDEIDKQVLKDFSHPNQFISPLKLPLHSPEVIDGCII